LMTVRVFNIIFFVEIYDREKYEDEVFLQIFVFVHGGGEWMKNTTRVLCLSPRQPKG
jgi:hypothetical protein